jgi:signal transduction histidine kinase
MQFKMTILRKGLLLLAMPILAQGIFLGLLFVMRGDQNEAEKWTIHSGSVIAKAQTMVRVLQTADARMMSYVLTGEARMLEPYNRARAKFPLEVAELRELVRDRPLQQEKLDRIAAEARDLFDAWDELGAQAGPKGREPAVIQRQVDQASLQLDGVRAFTKDFLDIEEDLARQRQANLTRVRAVQFWLLVGGAILTAVGAVLLAQFFRRAIGDRLRVLTENTRRLAAGQDLAPRLRGHDEISQLDRVFHDMAEVLAQRNRENAMFVYSVSHDLRAPLINLHGFGQELATVSSELRALMVQGPVPPAIRQAAIRLLDCDLDEAVHFIQTGVVRLSGIIDAMLRLSRAGRVEYHWQPVDIQATVQRVVESLWDTISKKSIDLTVADLPPLVGDPTALEQLFANLIGNAVKYLADDRPGKIEVGSLAAGDVVPAAVRLAEPARVYFVKDNGLGIPEECLSEVFAAFHRLHPAVAEGEGIGLALVKQVVERHGGRICAESTVGSGSTFFVALPARCSESTSSVGAVEKVLELESSDPAHAALTVS